MRRRFERIWSLHRLRDFGVFEVAGDEVVRRWYKCRWADSADGIASTISGKLDELVRKHLDAAEQRLTKEQP